MKQKYVFLETEGDRWFERNREKLAAYDIETDPVVAAIRQLGLKPQQVLEVGCSNGLRLHALRDAYGCDIMGIEPSREACMDAAANRVPVVQSTASNLVVAGPFDLIIYGFCLYLADPSDWLRIAAEGDGLLTDGGHLIIHDFNTVTPASARKYMHRPGLLAYHMDWASLWLAHPWYSIDYGCSYRDRDEYVAVLKKNVATIQVNP